MAEDTRVEESESGGEIKAPVRKKRAARRVAAKKAPQRKAAKKTAGRKKAASAKKIAGKAAARKKAARKKVTAKVESPAAPLETGPRRRGRPVSVDALRRKLETAREMVEREREKRRETSAAAKEKIAEHVARNKALRTELAEARRLLAHQDARDKEAERERAEAEKMEHAREAAVAKFIERWEKEYRKKTGTKQAKRGRPRRKRRTKKSAA